MICCQKPSLLAGLLSLLLVAPAVGGAWTGEGERGEAAGGPLLVINGGRPGPLRGRVPIQVDARAYQSELAFVVLRIGDREAFLSNSPHALQEWDTRQYPDGRYRLVAEAYAKAWLLARSPAFEIEIRNADDERGRSEAQGRGLAARPRRGEGGLPSPIRKSITVVSPAKVTVLRDGVSVQGGSATVPVRRVVEAAGGQVDWEAASRRVTAAYGGHRASMIIGRRDAWRDGEAVRLDATPRLRAGRTRIPARSLADLLGLFVGWVHEAKSVQFIDPARPSPLRLSRR